MKEGKAYYVQDTPYKTREEAQKAELKAIFEEEHKQYDAGVPWVLAEMIEILVKHADQIRDILAPAIGRPSGSRNGVRKRERKPAATPANSSQPPLIPA